MAEEHGESMFDTLRRTIRSVNPFAQAEDALTKRQRERQVLLDQMKKHAPKNPAAGGAPMTPEQKRKLGIK